MRERRACFSQSRFVARSVGRSNVGRLVELGKDGFWLGENTRKKKKKKPLFLRERRRCVLVEVVVGSVLEGASAVDRVTHYAPPYSLTARRFTYLSLEALQRKKI